VPLAIELAAARVPQAPARALLHRLESRFEVLRRPAGTAGAARHASLEAAIDASWDALESWEQDALAQSSVFCGGFTIEAAEAVIDLGAHEGGPSVLDVIEGLRAKSLLFAGSGASGTTRLVLDRSVRAYAAGKLARRAEVEERHAEYYARAAENWARALDRQGDATSRARVLAEKDNLLHVAARVTAGGRVSVRAAEPALRALLALAPALLAFGPLDAYANVLGPALHATKDSGADPSLTARVLLVRGAISLERRQVHAAATDFVRALGIARTVRDSALETRALAEIGRALHARGEYAAAADHFERAMEAERTVADRAAEGTCARGLGVALLAQGRVAEARAMLERAQALHAAAGASWALAEDHRALGALHVDLAHHDEARTHLAAAEARAREAGDARGASLAAGLSALLAHDTGDLISARRRYSGAMAELEDLGFLRLASELAGRLGVVAREEGLAAEAYALLSDACLRIGGGTPLDAILAAHLAALEAEAGRPARDAAAHAVAIAQAEAIAHRSADARIFLRCTHRPAPAQGPDATPADDALLLGAAGAWFRAPGGARVSLARRHSLALLLDRLAVERLARPGAPLPSEALQSAAWPGEKILHAAGAHRVRVAVATLRKLGLREHLLTTPEGYMLDPAVPAIRGSTAQ
jgi:tetratricopeptide (TPR) repeat protein